MLFLTKRRTQKSKNGDGFMSRGYNNNSENKEQDRYKNLKTAGIIIEILLNGVDTIFGLPGDGINGVIEALSSI
jgi:hypothetical protein